jgi:hypothetical protein
VRTPPNQRGELVSLGADSLGFFAIVAFNGIDDVALVFLATDILGGGEVHWPQSFRPTPQYSNTSRGGPM